MQVIPSLHHCQGLPHPASVPTELAILPACRVPACDAFTPPHDITRILSWKAILISLHRQQRGRHGS